MADTPAATVSLVHIGAWRRRQCPKVQRDAPRRQRSRETSIFGGRRDRPIVGRPATLWTTVVERNRNCYAPTNRLRSC